jgi:hypothetical protein
MLGGGVLVAELFGSVVGVVGSDLFVVLIVGSQSKGWLGGSPFLLSFVLFGQSFGLEVAVGVLKWPENGDIVWVRLFLPVVVLLLVGLQLD